MLVAEAVADGLPGLQVAQVVEALVQLDRFQEPMEQQI
jgi:hypothetical protein